MTSISISWWLVLVFAGPAALLIAMRLLRRAAPKLPPLSKTQQWVDQGCCHACGYNLKGVESYMCPECGTVRLYSARQWKAKLAADAAKLAEKQQQQRSA
jgi:predicted RNA-binding Zn-ribbon protein involved in translation (DUF1610 family)